MSEPSLLIESLMIEPRKTAKSATLKSAPTTSAAADGAATTIRAAPCSPDHYNPTVREVNIPKLANGSCGFDLSRSKWDPYPWVSDTYVYTNLNVFTGAVYCEPKL